MLTYCSYIVSTEDTMLLLFWIPIFLSKLPSFYSKCGRLIAIVYLVVIACGLYQGIPIVLTSAQDLAKLVLHNRRFYCLVDAYLRFV